MSKNTKKAALPATESVTAAPAVEVAAPTKSAPKKVARAPKDVAVPVVAADPTVQPIDGGDGEGDDQTKGRFFKLITNEGVARGRFSGNKPKHAANKALTAIIKSMGKDAAVNNVIPFTIKECTRGSKTKLYSYTGQRLQLDKPIEVNIGKGADQKTILYKFTNQVKKAPRPEVKDDAKAPVVEAVVPVAEAKVAADKLAQ